MVYCCHCVADLLQRELSDKHLPDKWVGLCVSVFLVLPWDTWNSQCTGLLCLLVFSICWTPCYVPGNVLKTGANLDMAEHVCKRWQGSCPNAISGKMCRERSQGGLGSSENWLFKAVSSYNKPPGDLKGFTKVTIWDALAGPKNLPSLESTGFTISPPRVKLLLMWTSGQTKHSKSKSHFLGEMFYILFATLSGYILCLENFLNLVTITLCPIFCF